MFSGSGMLPLSAQRSRTVIGRESTKRKAFWRTILRTYCSIVPMVEHDPISAKNKARLHQFGNRVPPGSFMGCVLYAGRIWNGDIFVADVEELQIFGRVRDPCSKAQSKRSSRAEERRRFYIFTCTKWNSEFGRKRSRSPNIHPDLETTRSKRESSRWFSRRSGRI